MFDTTQWILIYSHAPLQRGTTYRDFTNSTAVIAAEHAPDLNLTTDTPYLALTGKPWGANREEIQERWHDRATTAPHCITIYMYCSRLWSGRHFPESRHVVDSTLFHIALCANQFRVWNRYHIMTPVYVSVIYFILFYSFFFFLHSFPSETSPEHFNRVFSTCAVRKTKTLGTEWMLVVEWLIFGHGVFPAVKSNRVENAPCDVTREILLNIIHTHQIKKDKRN